MASRSAEVERLLASWAEELSGKLAADRRTLHGSERLLILFDTVG